MSDNHETDDDGSLGYVVTDGPNEKPRVFLTALFGDGRLLLGSGNWGDMGMLQILGTAKPHDTRQPAAEKGQPRYAELAQCADDGDGMMLLFHGPEDVERLITALTSIKTAILQRSAK